MSNTMRYTGLNSNRGPSAGLWQNCRWAEIKEGMLDGFTFEDDFLSLAASGSGYQRLAADGGSSAALIGTEVGGVQSLITGATLNNEVYQNSGNAAGVLGLLATTQGPLWYETRVRVSALAGAGIFVGLAEAGLAVANTIADTTGAMADKSYVGFRVLNATPTSADLVYHTNGGAAEVVNQAGAAGSSQILAAATWIKLGLYGDGSNLYYYINGIPANSTPVAYSATSFPTSAYLSAFWGVKTTTAASVTLDIDWIRFAQLAL